MGKLNILEIVGADSPVEVHADQKEIHIFVRKDDVSRLKGMLDSLEMEETFGTEGPVTSVGRDGREIVLDYMETLCDLSAERVVPSVVPRQGKSGSL